MIYVPMLKLLIFNIRIKQINDAYRPYSIEGSSGFSAQNTQWY